MQETRETERKRDNSMKQHQKYNSRGMLSDSDIFETQKAKDRNRQARKTEKEKKFQKGRKMPCIVSVLIMT
jgi:hypothetical protein